MDKFCRTFKNQELFARISEVSPSAVKLFGFLVDRAEWRSGRFIDNSGQMASELGLTTRSIQRASKELVTAGLIKNKRGGIYAINPEYVWGGRSWNRPKASYYTMNNKTAQVINFADAAQALSEEALERAGHETLREVSARKLKGN